MTKDGSLPEREIRQFLTLSTVHVSPGAQVWLETMGWANAKGEEFPSTHMVASFRDGWIVRVPSLDDDNFHADLREIAAEAALCGCTHFMLDRDAEVIGSLPVYEDDENSLDGFSEEEKAALLALADAGGLHDELDDGNPFDPESPEGRAYRDGRIDATGAAVEIPIEPDDDSSWKVPTKQDMRHDAQRKFMRANPPIPTYDALGHELPADLSEEDRENWLVEAADKKERRAAIHPEDGRPMESDPALNLDNERKWIDGSDIGEVKAAAADVLAEIASEIEQRRYGGNDEVWEPLEAKRARLEAALEAI